jgi:hypothetical protein
MLKIGNAIWWVMEPYWPDKLGCFSLENLSSLVLLNTSLFGQFMCYEENKVW